MSDTQIDIHQLPAKFAELLAAAAPGNEIIITDGDVPRAKLVPLQEAEAKPLKRRILGLNRGAVLWMSDDFDDPLPDDFMLGDDA